MTTKIETTKRITRAIPIILPDLKAFISGECSDNRRQACSG